MPLLLAIGEALIDIISNEFVTNLSEAKQFTAHTGGSPANFCMYAKACGTSATLIAAIGDDGLGKIVLADLANKGIDCSHIQVLENHYTSTVFVGKSKNTPDFIPYRDADKNILPIEKSVIDNHVIVHSTSFALSQQPAQQNILDALSYANDKGKLISIDWNYAENIWGKLNNAKDVLAKIDGFNPLLKFSLDDINRFTDKQNSVDEAKCFLHHLQAKMICLTCGSNGVWYKCNSNNEWLHKQAPPVQVIDSTGAGDSFWAGFITAYLDKKPIDDCIDFALATAAKKLQGLL